MKNLNILLKTLDFHRIVLEIKVLEMDSRATQVKFACMLSFRITHLITIIQASQLHFLVDENTERAGGSQ